MWQTSESEHPDIWKRVSRHPGEFGFDFRRRTMQQGRAQTTSGSTGVSAKVPFTLANVTKCQCPKCPVQANSDCAQGKIEDLRPALKKSPLRKEDIPGVYCATSKATCPDLDPSQACICGGCDVWKSYKLAAGKPQSYYCKDGFAR